LQDERAVHQSRPERDVTRRYIAPLTLSRATQAGLLKTSVFNRIEFFVHTPCGPHHWHPDLGCGRDSAPPTTGCHAEPDPSAIAQQVALQQSLPPLHRSSDVPHKRVRQLFSSRKPSLPQAYDRQLVPECGRLAIHDSEYLTLRLRCLELPLDFCPGVVSNQLDTPSILSRELATSAPKNINLSFDSCKKMPRHYFSPQDL
jgi:hypothetical protein